MRLIQLWGKYVGLTVPASTTWSFTVPRDAILLYVDFAAAGAAVASAPAEAFNAELVAWRAVPPGADENSSMLCGVRLQFYTHTLVGSDSSPANKQVLLGVGVKKGEVLGGRWVTSGNGYFGGYLTFALGF